MEWEGIDQAIAALDALKASVGDASRTIAQESAQLVESTARGMAPKRTGTLARSISTYGLTATGPASYEDRTAPHVVYGRIIELGGTIHAHNPTGRLWFRIDGHLVSPVSVTIPPHPYLAPALAASTGGIQAIAEARWAAALGV